MSVEVAYLLIWSSQFGSARIFQYKQVSECLPVLMNLLDNGLTMRVDFPLLVSRDISVKDPAMRVNVVKLLPRPMS
jgi:hypothetical protein